MKSKLHTSENGLVSIIVTMILMIIMTIIVLGFAQNARRELRNQLDRQLSTQAFYAAESGVNDARKALSNSLFSGTKSDCPPDGSAFFPANSNQIDGANVMYTCLLIDSTPESLFYGGVGSDKATTAEVKTVGGDVMETLTISWKCTKANAADPGCVPDTLYNGKFAPAGNWKQGTPPVSILGVLRTSITDLSGGYSRAWLNGHTMTSFLYPHAGGAAEPWSVAPVNQGKILMASCTSDECSVTISVGGLSHIFLNLVSIYKDSDVTITARDSSNAILALSGAQVKVDATGKAVDVLRRIQVRIPITPPAAVPAPVYAVQSVNGICKTLEVAPGNDPSSDPPLPHAVQTYF